MTSTNNPAPTSINGNDIGPVGYGMMSLTFPWALVAYPDAVNVLKTALDRGSNFWNGGTFYGTPEANSLHILRHYFSVYPSDASKIVLSIKGAFSHQGGPDGSPEGIRKAVEDAISILPPDVKSIDIFQCARVDPNVPVETSIEALAELVKEGKIKGIGLSECNANTIRRAHKIHPISAVEIELSLFSTEVLENGVVETCHELEIPIAAYSPVGRGWLTNQWRSVDDIPKDDMRRNMPRFQAENVQHNMKLVDAVRQIAERKGVSVAQVAIGWVCKQGAIPIPGSGKAARVVENSQPAELTEEEMKEIQGILESIVVKGGRYPAGHEKLLNG